MIGEVTTVDLTALLGAAGSTASPAQSRTVFDIAQFQNAYARAGQTVEMQDPAKVAAPSQAQESEGFRAVLNTLNALNGRAAGLGDNAGISATKDMSPGDMLMMTVRCHEFMFHCELTANVANRSSDGVQQLFRQQS
ncbi:MAG: hypothetical protein J0I77_17135 [Rudaea sp.]|uniref:hypothetical protein n=1 Tax=unclassified Rudaea TaxID=2627037 RepID=UPI0010F82216|nr:MULTISPECIES: hypothetical protein [unclassified Rudaea]MBN8887451.1 hypothetical protein [Rudaea sp.]MBR0345095.1 hypothetical protein [Rudaea sp.]